MQTFENYNNRIYDDRATGFAPQLQQSFAGRTPQERIFVDTGVKLQENGDVHFGYYAPNAKAVTVVFGIDQSKNLRMTRDENGVLRLEQVFTYDSNGSLVEVVKTIPEYEQVDTCTIEYDDSGRVKAVTSDSNIGGYWHDEYTYNEQGQIATFFGGGGVPQLTTYEYDEYGNCVFEDGGLDRQYYVNEEHLITSGAVKDESGKTLYTLSYTYDDRKRVRSCVEQSSNITQLVMYSYDYQPFVVQRTTSEGTVGNTTMTLYSAEGAECYTINLNTPQLYADADGYLAKIEDVLYDKRNVTYEFCYDDQQVPTTEKEIQDTSWCELYGQWLANNRAAQQYDADLWESVEYTLFYLDNDDIPEIFIQYMTTAEGAAVLSCQNGRVIEYRLMGFPALQYTERGNVLYVAMGRQGTYFDQIIRLENGQFASVGGVKSAVLGEDNVPSVDEFIYTWDGVTVTEEEYQQQIDTYIDLETASSMGKKRTYYEMMTYLVTAE